MIGQQINIPDVSPKGILSLEFAGTNHKAQKIVDTWKNFQVLDQALQFQWIDFIFILFYSTTLILACYLSTKCLSGFRSSWLRLGNFLVFVQIFAALLDVIENIILFTFLYEINQFNLPIFLVEIIFILKFLLIFLVLFYVFLSALIRGFQLYKSRF